MATNLALDDALIEEARTAGGHRTKKEIEEYEEAARCANRCRAAGIAGSSVDFLICTVALSRKLAILTTDGDFKNFAKVLPITLLGH